MLIGGYLPVSLCDWPGTVAAVVFTVGCDYRCPWCHNGGLLGAVPADPPVPEAEVLEKLMTRRGKLGGVVVTGGEPTLQPDLADFCAKLKQLGFGVKLDTNGTRPGVVEKLFAAKLVDFVAMDIKAPWAKYPLLTGTTPAACHVEDVKRTMALIAASGLPHQFRTTKVDPLLSAADYAAIRAQIPAGSPYVTQPFIAANALDPRLRPS